LVRSIRISLDFLILLGPNSGGGTKGAARLGRIDGPAEKNYRTVIFSRSKKAVKWTEGQNKA